MLQLWTGGREYGAFVNARSAFAALAASRPTATVWLPAFICPELSRAVEQGRLRFYPVKGDFEADLASVERDAAPGDMVLLVAQFGLPLSRDTHGFVRRRTDLVIVEDRSQALDAGPVSGWALYSPRKLLGVADGGLLVAPVGETPPQPHAVPDTDELWRAANLRLADPSAGRSSEWHKLNQAKEAAMPTTSMAISPLSLEILSRTSLSSLAECRRRNWDLLDRRLNRWSALPSDPIGPPLGYVLRLEPGLRDALLRALHADCIFAAVHWRELPVARAEFPREWKWSSELVSLPCDHRYGEAEMVRVSDRVLDFLE